MKALDCLYELYRYIDELEMKNKISLDEARELEEALDTVETYLVEVKD